MYTTVSEKQEPIMGKFHSHTVCPHASKKILWLLEEIIEQEIYELFSLSCVEIKNTVFIIKFTTTRQKKMKLLPDVEYFVMSAKNRKQH